MSHTGSQKPCKILPKGQILIHKDCQLYTFSYCCKVFNELDSIR